MHAIIKEEEARRQKYRHQQRHQEMSAKAYKLFSEGKRPVQVAITLNLGLSQITKLCIDYWKLKRLHILNLIHKETNGKLEPFLKLYKELIKKRRMSIEQVVNVVEIAIYKLPHMESLYEQVKEQVKNMQCTIQRLENDIETRKNKISILDKTAFSSEQDYKQTEQRVQELTAKKNRIEKLIATMLNDDNEDYAKLKVIVKERVKAVLSDNKTLISTAFAAVIQTLKTDPQIVKLIQNIPSAADDNDSNNITKYFEINRHSLLNLGEKNYKNLAEALTNNVMNTATNTSYNPTLLLPQSSTFTSSFDQSDNTYTIEDPESFHNRKGDIAD
jgi:DNA repair exonuclease SbcCD ATPase subunit